MPFRTADEAASQILRVINPRSIIEDFEYAGLIYRTPQGFDYTIPRRGGTDWDRGNASLTGIQIPRNAVEVGNYHTHGDYTFNDHWDPVAGCSRSRRAVRPEERVLASTPFGTPMLLGDSFSAADLTTATERGRGVPGYRAYLGTPSGILYYWEPPHGRNQVVLFRGTRPVIPAHILAREAGRTSCPSRP